MKFTVDLEDRTVADLMRLTGITKKGPAVARAVTEYLKREMNKEFATRVMEGEFEDYPMTNDEIEGVDR
ncbi:MAG: type II toxin-antitoxin system VapB family antitoxin [Verrucomicrobiales bacterium]|nr:type II toxin-antitoxin system VapB family antitoxin [Verrucomicrobiales bacterium]